MSGQRVDVKVVMLGKEYVGKTSLVERYVHNRFLVGPYQNDTAGSERYEAMSRIYYRGARAAIVCYDLTDSSSFQRAKFWVTELQNFEENCQIYLCGTKSDLLEEDRKKRGIDFHDVQDYADEIKAELFETSSKTGQSVDELFQKVAEDYVQLMAFQVMTGSEVGWFLSSRCAGSSSWPLSPTASLQGLFSGSEARCTQPNLRGNAGTQHSLQPWCWLPPSPPSVSRDYVPTRCWRDARLLCAGVREGGIPQGPAPGRTGWCLVPVKGAYAMADGAGRTSCELAGILRGCCQPENPISICTHCTCCCSRVTRAAGWRETLSRVVVASVAFPIPCSASRGSARPCTPQPWEGGCWGRGSRQAWAHRGLTQKISRKPCGNCSLG
ncbi:ras-related protein Rab-24 isoform X2 [Chrysemys picta bellii]|uniref:ras-related protein Rab-24 isoform X2 n=1 Tax=Chrysemys picta bellii TaxID=8478 RepID=UPI001C686DAF|nr:ras-related protein Rab-24 isoform X2 [Chrysemys picta bellii]